MTFLEGKTPTEKKKIIAAALLGVVALGALWMAFGRSFFGGSTTASAKPTPTPKTSTSSTTSDVTMPSVSDRELVYQSTAIDYTPGDSGAPDPGRNIFAFREPDPPCPECPVPAPKTPEPRTPSPTPTPVYALISINPPTLYAGSKGFRLEANGDRFTPDAQIYFNQVPMPTTFVSPQKLVTDIPANLIAQEGARQVIVQSRDGKSYSDQAMMSIQAPPRPTVQYIGMIGRKRYNNDTAYFTEGDKGSPFGARLNDVVNNRFRLIAIAPAEVTFQDVDLGFKHRVKITQLTGGGMPGAGVGSGGISGPGKGMGAPFDPGSVPAGDIPGIPNNIPRYNPGVPGSIQPSAVEAAPQKKPIEKKDVDDDE